ncbi:MAG: helicase-exonuclease AddAB subunit AddA, partial [Peptococcaceae bacterium]|nr:helicase-exonuclease AddAB subunit AddA [Peptococcaceae bacterium]
KWFSGGSVKVLPLPEDGILKSCNYLDWLGAALIRHKKYGGALRIHVRNLDDNPEYLLDDPSDWSINIQRKSDITKNLTSSSQVDFGVLQDKQKAADLVARTDWFGEIDRKLSWRYPYQKGTLVPAKLSVTELKRYFELGLPQDAYLLSGQKMVKKPMFLESKSELSSAEAGTAMHFIMQHLDFSDIDISGQIKKMVNRDLITLQQAESADPEKITGFINSSLGLRLAASGKINREVPFNIEIPCYEIYPDLRESIYHGEAILLQGVIDCYFEEPDGLVLIDYKTDYVADYLPDSLKEKFNLQISYYARALEMLSGKRVKEKYVYLFWNGEVLTF